MMQTLTKMELQWILDALKHDIQTDSAMLKNAPIGSLTRRLAELHRDNLQSVLYKVANVIETDAKRIAIK